MSSSTRLLVPLRPRRLHGVVSAGYSLSRFVGFVGLGVFLFDCPLLILAGIALLGPALLLAFLSGAVRAW